MPRQTTNASQDERSPSEIANAAVEQGIEIADRDANGPIERATNQDDAINVIVEGLAEAVEAGGSRDKCERLITHFADEHRNVTKTEVMDRFKDEVINDNTGGPARMTNQLLKEDCKLTATATTDHDQEVTYQWDFGDCKVISKGSGGQSRYHLSEYQFRTEILSARGKIPRETGWDSDEWLAFISDFIHANASRSEVEGPLTLSATDISNYIENHEAFAPIEALQAYEGVFIPEESDWTDGDESEVWVPSNVITDIADKYSVDSISKLSAELDARAALARTDSASVRVSVGGKRRCYWVFRREYAEPLDYKINPDNLDDPSGYVDGSVDPLDGDDEEDGESEESDANADPDGDEIDYDAFEDDDGGDEQ